VPVSFPLNPLFFTYRSVLGCLRRLLGSDGSSWTGHLSGWTAGVPAPTRDLVIADGTLRSQPAVPAATRQRGGPTLRVPRSPARWISPPSQGSGSAG
jgi:hypothetical protein